MGILGPTGTYVYQSDDGNSYTLKQRAALATAVGNVAYTGTPALPGFPKGRVPRVVYGQNVTGGVITRKRVWIGDPADTEFVAGAGFTVDSLTFTVLGRIGEKRRGRS